MTKVDHSILWDVMWHWQLKETKYVYKEEYKIMFEIYRVNFGDSTMILKASKSITMSKGLTKQMMQ